MSVTPSIHDDDDEERDTVSIRSARKLTHTHFPRQKRRKTKAAEIPPALRERMKKAFKVCYLAGLTYDDDTSRKRCELYKELQDKNARDTALL